MGQQVEIVKMTVTQLNMCQRWKPIQWGYITDIESISPQNLSLLSLQMVRQVSVGKMSMTG